METIPSEQQTVRVLTEWANMSLTALVFWEDLWHGILLSAGRITPHWNKEVPRHIKPKVFSELYHTPLHFQYKF